jgi:hypothetical protein
MVIKPARILPGVVFFGHVAEGKPIRTHEPFMDGGHREVRLHLVHSKWYYPSALSNVHHKRCAVLAAHRSDAL